MLKKIIAFALCALLSASLSSCTLFRPYEEESTDEKEIETDILSSDTDEKGEVTDDTTENSRDTEDTSGEDTRDSEDTSGQNSAAVDPVIPTRKPGDPITICIDAGHGYVDPGCSTDYLNGKYERDIVAEYAEKLKLELEALGARVILLRNDDEYITAAKVAEEADKVGLDYMPEKLVDDSRFAAYNRTVWANVLHRYTYIDAFISLHIDTYTADESVRGTRVYYCSENAYSSASALYAGAITSAIGSALPEQKARLYPKNAAEAFIVTKHSQMPSALVEIGFATNKTDAENILNEEWRGKFVTAVASGIMTYFE